MLDQDVLIWGAVAAGIVFLLTFLVPERKKPAPAHEHPEALTGYPVPKQWEEKF
jgi:hypothetical protein